MPANLTPEYLEAEKWYREAQTPDEKMEALRRMASVIPKHKGTEKMRADIKKRISKLTDSMQQARKSGRRAQLDHVEREGAGQLVIAGAPNAGKSSLLAALTNAKPDVAAYPFATQKPLPGMMLYEDIQIQLVDTPAMAEEMTPPWLRNTIRNGDGVLLLINLAEEDVAAQADMLMAEIEKCKVELVREEEEDERIGWMKKPAIVVGVQTDQDRSGEREKETRTWLGDVLPMVTVSTTSGDGLDDLRRAVFDLLRLVRVYSKIPSKPPDMTHPFVLKRGSTVLDVARLIHKELASNLKHARIWGHAKYDGQNVHRDYAVQDGDVLELHMR